MNGFSYFLFIILALFTPAHEVSVFQDRVFYEEWLHRSDSLEFSELKRRLDSPFFQKTQNLVNRSLLRRLEAEGVLASWTEHPAIFLAFLREALPRKAEDRRYYYLRRALRQARRSVTHGPTIRAVDSVLQSDFPALISEPRFRSMLASLEQLGVLHALFKVTADLNFLSRVPGFKEKWDQTLEKDSENLALATVRAMMVVAQGYPESVRVRARRIRDSGYYEQFYEKEAQALMQEGLFRVFQSYLVEGELADSIQAMMHQNLLVSALDQASIEVNRFLASGVRNLKNISAETLEIFVASSGFKIFQDARWIVDLLHLEKEGVLLGLAETLPLWKRLLEEKYALRFREVDDLMQARARIGRLERDVARIALASQKVCYANMRLLMQAREEYNLKYRQEIDLQDAKKTRRLYELLGARVLKGTEPKCPDLGEYHSTEYGWITCSIHGKLPLESHE
jgi:hypothetical protein